MDFEASAVSFKQFLLEAKTNQTLKVSPFDQEDVSGWIVSHIDNLIGSGQKPQVKMVSPSDTYATQRWLDEFGIGDPVFEQYSDKPVLVKIKDKLHIIDGHHRMSRAAKLGNQKVSAYIFEV